MKEIKYRHELKHEINYLDYLALSKRLNVIAKRDSNVGEDGCYRVRSLYFDNIHDKVLREKLDGVNNREKFRIRFYNEEYDFIKLEKKSKVNGLCQKQSIAISKDDCEKIIAGDFSFLKDRKEALLLELFVKMQYQQLRPKTIIDYKREPYIYEPGNVRITIDYEIETGLSSKELFNPYLATVNVCRPGCMILEVKYDEFLPDIIRDVIQIGDRKAEAFSKYAAGRIFG